jgi:hypothetical protein
MLLRQHVGHSVTQVRYQVETALPSLVAYLEFSEVGEEPETDLLRICPFASRTRFPARAALLNLAQAVGTWRQRGLVA